MSIKLSKNIHKTINLIHSKLQSVNNLISKTNSIINKCKNIDLSILNFNTLNISNNIKSFNNIFNKECIKCTPRLFSNKGIILSSYQLFNNIKDNIKDILKYIGFIDYLNSNHLLIKKFNNSKNIYSFTKYKNKKKPNLNLKIGESLY